MYDPCTMNLHCILTVDYCYKDISHITFPESDFFQSVAKVVKSMMAAAIDDVIDPTKIIKIFL